MEIENQGYWGAVTSTMDWCEENYEYSPYVAEFWNTLSNFWILFFGAFGAVHAFRHQSEKYFSLTYFGLFIVGIGSFLFHCTLKWETQLLDEVPMIFCSMPILYCIYGATINSKSSKKLLAIILCLYPLIVVPTYIVFKAYIFFEFAYGATVFALVFGGYSLTTYIKTIVPKNELEYPNNPFQLYVRSLFYYGLGFAIWQFDNNFCQILQSTRISLGPYIAPVFQFHALWHFGSGYGTYLCIISCQISYDMIKRHCQQYKKENKKSLTQQPLICDYFKGGLFPYVRKMNQDEIQKYCKEQ